MAYDAGEDVLYSVETKRFVFEVVVSIASGPFCWVHINRYYRNEHKNAVGSFDKTVETWWATTEPVPRRPLPWWRFLSKELNDSNDFDTIVEKAIEFANKEAGIVGPMEEKIKEKAEDLRFLEQAVRELDAAY